uniref:1-phosphatidylinositol 4,5-bisphosphate phosphodiesterase n=1 Tax=Saccoglossus kowalevskii TaxID=10224 RepID=A0ABM0M6H8_SACKO|nr:PREDICTED: 1-phosphatidylinositol 4,5-bisphosphate phosphodiesterase classes I and II-like [Saccoglossus kowalevskii]
MGTEATVGAVTYNRWLMVGAWGSRQFEEVDCLTLSSVRDTRTGKYAKVPKEGKLRDTCTMGSPDVFLEDKSITIVYGPDFVQTQMLNFCANRETIAKEWAEALLEIAYNMLALNGSPLQYWEKMYSKLIITSPIEEKVPVKHIIKKLANSKDDRKKVEHALQAIGLPSGKNDVIPTERFTLEDFFIFYIRLTNRGEIDKVFQEIGAKNKPYLTVLQFKDFLNSVQRDPRLNEVLFPLCTEKKTQELIDDYEPNKSFAKKGHLSMEGFTKYLMSFDNYIITPDNYELNEDMDQPLSHYLINSSHNTYLTGHQLTGKSSVEIYRQCLLAGCRCVELDCWDGKAPEEEPIITHGYTMCTEILFKDVIEAIAESAFKTSEYPVILSFENHCSPKQQAKMANYCRSIFGDLLLIETVDDYPLKSGVPLPSPKMLMRKIIVKNKKKKEVPEKARKRTVRKQSSSASLSSKTQENQQRKAELEKEEAAKTSSNEAEMVDVNDMSETCIADQNKDIEDGDKEQPTEESEHKDEDSKIDSNRFEMVSSGAEDKESNCESSLTSSTSVSPEKDKSVENIEKMDTIDEDYESDSDDEKEGLSKEELKARQKEKREKGTAGQEVEAGAEMSALVNYVTPVHFHSFEYSEKRNRSYELSSFVETTAMMHVKGTPVEFVNYNKRQLSRIYPKGTRIDSMNYMPQVFWNCGCQLVALNFQILDLAMQLNMGIFEYNGRCGYILKPEFMRRSNRRFDPFAESTVDGIVAGTVSVKVISGQFLSDKKVSTYVEVDMYGLPADTVRKRFRTKTVQGNGISPIYDEEPFVFKKVVLPNLAVLRIAVLEENGKLIGHRILPLEGLQPGYRHISLRNEANQSLTLPTLFMKINVKDYVPDTLTDFAAALANPIAYQNMIEKREKQLQELTEDFENEDTDQLDQFGRMKMPTEKDIVGAGNEENGNAEPNTAQNSKQILEFKESNGSSSVSYTKSNGEYGSKKANAKALLTMKESTMCSKSGHSIDSVQNSVPRSSSLANTRLLMASNSIAEEEIHRTKSAPMLDQAVEIEAANSTDIKTNKKFVKLVSKQQKELDKMIKKQEKVQSKLKKMQTQQLAKLQGIHNRNKDRLQKRHHKSMRKANKSKEGNLTDTVRQNDVEMQTILNDQQEKVIDLKKTHSNILIDMYKEHYNLEQQMRKKHMQAKNELLRNIMVNTHDNQLKDMDKFHKREESELQKRMFVQNREEMKTLNKRIKNKQEMQRLKREFQQKHINQAVTARKTLTEFQERKRKQLERAMKNVQEKLTEEENKSLQDIQDQFKRRNANLEREVLREQGLLDVEVNNRNETDTGAELSIDDIDRIEILSS